MGSGTCFSGFTALREKPGKSEKKLENLANQEKPGKLRKISRKVIALRENSELVLNFCSICLNNNIVCDS